MWRRVTWAVPAALFVGTFGVFSLRHPASVRAVVQSDTGVVTLLGAVAAVTALLLAAWRWRTVATIAPFVLALGVLAAAVYADVPFERMSTQNRTLVAAPVVERVIAGELRGINHAASGRVSIVESASGARAVRFAGFHVQGAPAPVLYVVAGRDVQSPTGTNLGAFTATDGDTLDVALPAGVEPGAGWTVLIWCERFATPIANATLA
jgi:hypothetical protein